MGVDSVGSYYLQWSHMVHKMSGIVHFGLKASNLAVIVFDKLINFNYGLIRNSSRGRGGNLSSFRVKLQSPLGLKHQIWHSNSI